MKKIKSKRTHAKKNCEEILCAGFGGQGIMFMGKLIAASGLAGGWYVTWMPSYGAEVRGGTAYSMAKVSSDYIASPIVANPDFLIVMNRPSLIKYEPRLKEGGVLIANRSLVGNFPRRKGIKVVNVPMTEIAHKIGDIRSANMVAMGALAKRCGMLSIRNVTNVLKEFFKDKEDIFLKNKKALDRGYKS
jgi:2-oxoglutarate ferredoxin oxidoreductase subunit gamma